LDLNVANEIYETHREKIQSSLEITTLDSFFRSALVKEDVAYLVEHLKGLAKFTELDFLGVVTGEGTEVSLSGITVDQ